MTLPDDRFPGGPPGDRLLAALFAVAVGAFALMLIWLVLR